jgi:osmotically inducible protein OsmC
MAQRTANAVWEGGLKDGKGTIELGSGAWEGPYSFGTRFEDAQGSNPEELLGAALAGCYSMALAAGLGREGHQPQRIATSAKVYLEKQDAGFAITRIELTTEGTVPGIDEAKFREAAETTKTSCIVSRALGGVKISVDARLTG